MKHAGPRQRRVRGGTRGKRSRLDLDAEVPRLPTGRFVYDTAAECWEWDEEVYRIHGFEPGSVTPTTELVLSKRPEDSQRIRSLLERVKDSGEAFSATYRVVGGDGCERRVVLVGGSGKTIEGQAMIEGFYIDLTDDFDQERVRLANLAVAASVSNWAAIEQAKGALMLAYGLDPGQASAMLHWWWRNSNVRVRALARQLVACEGQGTNAARRHTLDGVLHDLTS